MLFAIICTDKPGHAHVRAANRQAHIAHARKWAAHMVVGGPLLTPDGEGMVGSMFVIDLPDRSAVNAMLAEDPYIKAGLFESVVVRPYKKVLP